MSAVLFAIIGAKIDAGVWYWIALSIFCIGKLCISITEAAKEL